MNNVQEQTMPQTAMQQHIGSHKVNLAIGVFGMLVVIAGTFIPADMLQKIFYLVGAAFMLVSAALERQSFFVILEVIIVAGTIIALTALSNLQKEALPIILSVLALAYFGYKRQLADGLTLLGCVGLIVLAIGFAVTNPIVYLIGGVLLSIYSFGSYRRGVKIALIWAVLNAIFALTSLVAVARMVKS